MYRLTLALFMAFGLLAGPVPAIAVTEQAIYSFGTDGGLPASALLVMPNGTSYGVTSQGGKYNDGQVFKLEPPNATYNYWRESTIWSFEGPEDGYGPRGSLVAGPNGSLYGTTQLGGNSLDESCLPATYGCGTVFQLLPPAAEGSPWTKVILYSFNNLGGEPRDLFEDASGALYGTIGTTVYQLAPPVGGSSNWTFTSLYLFPVGMAPNQDLLIENGGVIYGTTPGGGLYGQGTLFSLTAPAGGVGGWSYANLYNFQGGTADGAVPNGGLVGGQGVSSPGIYLWGTTQSGGTFGHGTLFELEQPYLDEPFLDSIIHDFSGLSDGGVPMAGLFESDDGSYWGTASQGGLIEPACSTNGCGAVFELARQDKFNHIVYTFSVITSFIGPPSDGSDPITSLSADNNGSLYGITFTGGEYGEGTAFTLADAVPVYTVDTPVFEPKAGGYTTAQTITISDLTSGATIYYTTNGLKPIPGSTDTTAYTGAITVSGTETIKAIAVFPGYLESAVESATYTIAARTPKPQFSPKGGTYTGTQTVSIYESGNFAGVPIYYTTDGTKPTTSSTPYTGPITVSSTETIKAIASAAFYLKSDVASATYTIQ